MFPVKPLAVSALLDSIPSSLLFYSIDGLSTEAYVIIGSTLLKLFFSKCFCFGGGSVKEQFSKRWHLSIFLTGILYWRKLSDWH